MRTLEKKRPKKRAVRRKVSVDGPRPVDVHVGGRLRLRRTLLVISQEKLAESVNLTFQQIQKYERGTNRMGASRLYEMCGILDVPIGYFFEDMAKEVQKTKGAFAKGMADQTQLKMDSDPLTRRETLELVRAYYKITNPTVRKRLYELIRSMGKLNSE